jgi:hypothetical protein
MEQTDFHRMKPDRTLAAGSTRWVLANPDSSYIAYTDVYGKPIGVKGLKPGTFDLLWLDTVDGKSAWQRGVTAPAGGLFEKPAGYSNEVAVYIKRQ